MSDVKDDIEFLLNPKNNRIQIVPGHPMLKEFVEKFFKPHKAADWDEDEIPYTKDLMDWNKLNSREQWVLKRILCFFAISDISVNKKEKKDSEEVQVPEMNRYIINKEDRENTHNVTYGKHIEVLIPDKKERDQLFFDALNLPVVADKTKWLDHWTENGTFAERTVVTACVEGIFFSSSFATIFYFKGKNIMNALITSNEFISRDEGLHRDAEVYKYLYLITNKLKPEKVIQIIKDAVDLELRFVNEALGEGLPGLSVESLSDYVRLCAESLCNKLLQGKFSIYKIVKDPLIYMTTINEMIKADFFSRTVTGYSKFSKSETDELDEYEYNEDHLLPTLGVPTLGVPTLGVPTNGMPIVQILQLFGSSYALPI